MRIKLASVRGKISLFDAILIICLCFFPITFGETHSVLDVEQLIKSENYRYVKSEFTSVGPHLSVCEMKSELSFDVGFKLSYAMVAQTINSEKVGDTVTASLSINYDSAQHQEKHHDGWDVYINQQFIGTATVLTEMDQGTMVNFTMTEKYSGSIDSIIFVSKKGDLDQLISVCMYGYERSRIRYRRNEI